jgi:diacylglycerol kinase (ATP)
MRAAAIFGLGCSPERLKPFQEKTSDKKIEWRVGVPASAGEAEAVLLFGGDGTVHRHLSQLVELGLPVLVVPTGSGNDFARALGVRGTRNALAAWQCFCEGHGKVRAIDLGVIKTLETTHSAEAAEPSPWEFDHYFCTVAGVGLDCEVARRANTMPRFLRGHGGYALSVVSTVFRFAPITMKILADSAGSWVARSNRPTMLAAFANAPLYGGGMKIAPNAQMDDGQLDVCVIQAIDPFKLFCMFSTVYFGKHLKVSEVEYFRADRVRVETTHPVDVYADGESVCRTPVEVGVQAAALKVIVF